MSPSFRHDKAARRIGDMVVVLAEALGVAVIGGGSTTFRRRDLDRGLEPDECFYVQNVEAVRHLDEIDLTRDPPPDLVIEIDVTHASTPKEPVYAELGVGELWRAVRGTLQFRVLGPEGGYRTRAASRVFPRVRSAELWQFLKTQVGPGIDEVAFLRAARVGEPFLCPIDAAIHVLEIVEAALASSETGRLVRVGS